MNILIPMAGAGSRFEKAGYTFPKPLIDVAGQPMIQKVIKNLNLQGRYIFLVQKAHYEKYDLENLLNLIAPNCKIVQIEGLTEGAACTVLKAQELIDNNEPLIIANADQYIKWNSFETISLFNEPDVDGGILTFNSIHPNHSFPCCSGQCRKINTGKTSAPKSMQEKMNKAGKNAIFQENAP